MYQILLIHAKFMQKLYMDNNSIDFKDQFFVKHFKSYAT